MSTGNPSRPSQPRTHIPECPLSATQLRHRLLQGPNDGAVITIIGANINLLMPLDLYGQDIDQPILPLPLDSYTGPHALVPITQTIFCPSTGVLCPARSSTRCPLHDILSRYSLDAVLLDRERQTPVAVTQNP